MNDIGFREQVTPENIIKFNDIQTNSFQFKADYSSRKDYIDIIENEICVRNEKGDHIFY